MEGSFTPVSSGTTLLMCSRPAPGQWVYDGLFEHGKHVVIFDSVQDMHAKVLYYLKHEDERAKFTLTPRRLVGAGADLTIKYVSGTVKGVAVAN